MRCPIRCPYNGLNIMFPIGALPVEKGAVIKCTLCFPYMIVSQGFKSFFKSKRASRGKEKDDTPAGSIQSGLHYLAILSL